MTPIAPGRAGLRLAAVLSVALALLLPVGRADAAAADAALDKARSHYEMGIRLFDAGQNEQALVEFQEAYATKPRPAALFMMAQCEYTLGLLREARAHYEQYLRESPRGEYVDLARYRLQAIDKRRSVLHISTVPPDVGVRIAPEPAPGTDAAAAAPVVTGQAPNNFAVPRGRYRITLTKPGYVTRSVVLEVEVAEARPLLYTLDPVPARLEIETSPEGAILYVNGNRARNPYRQDVLPGPYEVFVEAPGYAPRTLELTLGPGRRQALTGAGAVRLERARRSGKPEILIASAALGALFGGGAVAAGIAPALDDERAQISTSSLVGGGAAAGLAGGLLVARALVPTEIPDHRALFVVGAGWIGAAEGALTGILLAQALAEPGPAGAAGRVRPTGSAQLRAGFLGAVPGLSLGTTAGILLRDRAPSYGRGVLVQSAAVGGALAGWLAAVGLEWRPFDWQDPQAPTRKAPHRTLDFALPALVGLNAGLAAGLVGVSVSDGASALSWQRVALVDLATGAGALAGGIAGCAFQRDCLVVRTASARARARSARAALAGAGVGLAAGIYFTRDLDVAPTPPEAAVSVLPFAVGAEGGVRPGLGLAGRF